MSVSAISDGSAAGRRGRGVSGRLAEEVRVLLARRDLKNQALVPVLGITNQAVSKKMRGMSSWTVEDLAALAGFFGVDANTLLPDIGQQGDGGPGNGAKLPHLDSNQEPAVQLSSQVRGGNRDNLSRFAGSRPRQQHRAAIPAGALATVSHLLPRSA